jgi:inosine triphosphate pyrophosphatase
MILYFVSGNKNKFEEVKAILADFAEIKMLDIDLPEIQELDSKQIIAAKLSEALRHQESNVFIEDISLSMEALNGLPGPLIKWFLKTMGPEGLAHIAQKLGNNKAEAKIVLGFAKNKDEICFFEGAIKGIIVEPRGESGFGWDKIFQPEGFAKTYGEMTPEEKNAVSMRKIALQKLKDFLKNTL